MHASVNLPVCVGLCECVCVFVPVRVCVCLFISLFRFLQDKETLT